MANPNKKDSKTWEPLFFSKTPLFKELHALMDAFKPWQYPNWPTFCDLNDFAGEYFNRLKIPRAQQVRFVHDDKGCQYETQIVEMKQVPTRLKNWHDWFNYLSWLLYPKTKRALAQHYLPTSHHRSIRQNAIAHFDECGVVICSSSTQLLQLACEFNWRSLFWEHRQWFGQRIQGYILGHGLWEKALLPYIGMCGHALCLKVPEDFFVQSQQDQGLWIDKQLSQKIQQPGFLEKTQDLMPFPLLGIPGMHHHNQSKAFYENQDYFRSLSQPHKTTKWLSKID